MSTIVSSAPKHALILDLGGVLLREAERNLQEVIPAEYAYEPGMRLFLRAFEFLTQVTGRPFLDEWLQGNASSNALVNQFEALIALPEHASFFVNEQERLLIQKAVRHIILAGPLVHLTTLDPEGLDFVKRCHKAGIRLLVLSNWDPESFKHIKVKYPELFNLFAPHDIFIPSYSGFRKPQPACYHHVMQHVGPEYELFFVDDSRNNVEAAERCGITSVWHAQWQETEQALIKAGLKF